MVSKECLFTPGKIKQDIFTPWVKRIPLKTTLRKNNLTTVKIYKCELITIYVIHMLIYVILHNTKKWLL